MRLTPRQQRFVEEYLIDLDPRHAARRAGYKRTNHRYCYAMLKRPPVAAAVSEAMVARAARTGITRAMVMEEYARIAFADPRGFADWGPHGVTITDAAALSEEAAAAIAVIGDAERDDDGEARLYLKAFDKLKALDALARLMAFASDKDVAASTESAP